MIKWKNHEITFGINSKNLLLLIQDDSEDKKPKGTKKHVIKRKLKLEDYKSCLKAAELENKINHHKKNKIDMNIHKKIIKKRIN